MNEEGLEKTHIDLPNHEHHYKLFFSNEKPLSIPNAYVSEIYYL